MAGSRLALRLAAHGSAFGIREELIGDLLEETARGRSKLWLCHQLIGVCGLAATAQLRRRARLTPHVIALVVAVMLVAAASIASARVVLAMWLGVYYVAGTLSLFAEMASHTIGASETAISQSTEAPQD